MTTQMTPQFPSPPAGKFGWPWTSDNKEVALEPLQHDDTRPMVTVIMPSFNQGGYLEEAIRSVILQDHPNLQFFVMDGGSTDQTVDVIGRYQPWIAFSVSGPDDGQADAINSGFQRATGEYICWLNSDDLLYQGFISRRVAEFRSRGTTDLIYGDIDTGWDNGERSVLCGEPLSFLEMLRTLRVSVPQQGAMWRRSTIERLGGLDPRWQVVLDREFFLRIIRQGTAEYIPGRCGFFRQHEGAKSIAEATKWVSELPQMYAELFADENLEPPARDLERETMAYVHLMCSDILRNAGDWAGSLRHLGKALGWSPGHAGSRFIAARALGLRRRMRHRVDTTNTRGERA